jgi:hypothetical protein
VRDETLFSRIPALTATLYEMLTRCASLALERQERGEGVQSNAGKFLLCRICERTVVILCYSVPMSQVSGNRPRSRMSVAILALPSTPQAQRMPPDRIPRGRC